MVQAEADPKCLNNEGACGGERESLAQIKQEPSSSKKEARSSDSTCSPLRRRVYWQKSTQNSSTPPRRKLQTYASMNCSRNSMSASPRVEDHNRSQLSNAVSMGRGPPRAVDGVEKYDVELWGSDDDDVPPKFCQR